MLIIKSCQVKKRCNSHQRVVKNNEICTRFQLIQTQIIMHQHRLLLSHHLRGTVTVTEPVSRDCVSTMSGSAECSVAPESACEATSSGSAATPATRSRPRASTKADFIFGASERLWKVTCARWTSRAGRALPSARQLHKQRTWLWDTSRSGCGIRRGMVAGASCCLNWL
jgi:hypothetical protein